MVNAAIIVAGGSGSRAAGDASTLPKQYRLLGRKTVLARTIGAYARHPDIHAIVTVIRAIDQELYDAAITVPHETLLPPAYGGATRQQSVLNGLRALTALNPHTVLIHDAARPFIEPACISRVLSALERADGAIAAIPVADTLKRGDADGITGTVDRTGLWAAQTPQGFRFAAILEAHEAAAKEHLTHFSDDAAIAEWRSLPVTLVSGSADNWKITTPEDLVRAERQLQAGEAMRHEIRTGTGFDVHSFETGSFVTLCGVQIPHTHKLNGHSDADAPLHALTDALLGTIGAGDIGDHFPPSDPQWRGADSALFLRHARTLIEDRGGHVVNVDITILAERPKISPHRDAMRSRIASILAISADRVGVKATTMEGLGFIGRREGIAAMASASVSLPLMPPLR